MEMQLTEGRPALVSKIKLTFGIFFTALGVLMTLDNLGVADAGRVLRYWPAVLIVVGVLLWKENRTVAIAATAIGALLVAANAHWLRFSLFELWPVILIAVGLVIVLRALGVDPATGGGGSIWAVLTTRKLSMGPRELDGRHIVAFMGGAELDLRDADDAGDVHIEVLAMWGGIELRVPPGWEVTGNVVPIMGGVEMKTGAAKNGRRVIVSGLVLMAGMEVKTS